MIQVQYSLVGIRLARTWELYDRLVPGMHAKKNLIPFGEKKGCQKVNASKTKVSVCTIVTHTISL